MRVLVVEDDPSLAALLRKWLTEHTYAVDVAADGARGLRQAAVATSDVIVLAVGLPGRSGLDVCRALRDRGIGAPVLMLAACDTVADRVAGLDSSADDYLRSRSPWPSCWRGSGRCCGAGRRSRRGRSPWATAWSTRTRSAPPGQRATGAGRDLGPTTKEHAMLAYLARHAGRVVGRAELSEYVWDDNHDPLSNVLEVYVARLRKKVDAWLLGPAAPRGRAAACRGHAGAGLLRDRHTCGRVSQHPRRTRADPARVPRI